MKISVVIPTYNESLRIAQTVACVKSLAGDFEIIIVDGQSSDGTAQIARSLGVRVIESERGRGEQMNRGAELATGEVLLFLHADTRLPYGASALIENALADGRVAGGCFRLSFDASHPGLRLFSYLSRFSFPLFHCGDAAYFVRRAAFEDLGCFRPYPIMEDVDFWFRMWRGHRTVIISNPVVTSARRFLAHGVMRAQSLNILLVLLYLIGVSPYQLKRFYPEVRQSPPFPPAGFTPVAQARYMARTLWRWAYSNVHLAIQTYYVLDFMWIHRLKAGLLADTHPWATGIIPGRGGEVVWDKNIVFATPVKSGGWIGIPPDPDTVIVCRIGKFLTTMVKRSIPTDPEIPQGAARRMPHGVNYIHGSINYNGGYILFNDFQEGMSYFSDDGFVEEFKRFAKAEKRELTVVFRERAYDPEEFAWFVAFVRAHLPWYANGNGPTKKRVLWGTPSPYAAVNPISGAWVLDMQRLYRGEMDKIVRPPIAERYFQGQYGGGRSEYSFMERFHAWAMSLIIAAKGFQGGLVFTKRRRIEPENWRKYQKTGGAWQSSYSVSHPFRRIESARARRKKPDSSS
ncbi:MAG: TIGR04283 family arsenosugar biosynthesis glycosyltransferase [Deltaproteobacteria bacterium]